MNLPWVLNVDEARVLGCLLEKQMATPEYYPLSLNALVNACNQKSNRDPEMTLDEDRVRLALRNLEEKGLASAVHEGRVPKFRHEMQEAFNLTGAQNAIVAELLLRGPQTPGELRSRADRMQRLTDLEQVQTALRGLLEHDPPLAVLLPRRPGEKEARYTQLLTGTPDLTAEPAATPAPARESLVARVETLELEVAALRTELIELRSRLDS